MTDEQQKTPGLPGFKDAEDCKVCEGKGTVGDGMKCPACGGEGWLPVAEDIRRGP